MPNSKVSISKAGVGGAMLTSSNVYDNAGLLVQTVNHDGSSIVYAYNDLNERVANIRIGAGQTLDFDPQSFILDDVIELDKYLINLTTERTENTEEEWWECSANVDYAPCKDALTTSVQRVQLTGLTLECNSRIISTDVNGNITVTKESLNPGNATKTTISIDTTLGITNVAYFVVGYETVSTNSMGGAVEHGYDGFARRVKTTNYANGRELKSVTAYNDDGSLATVGKITPTGTNTTSYSTRQAVIGEPGAFKITETDPQGHQTVNHYSGDGQLYRSEGATYPVAYAKNAAGQMAQLHTWRDESGNPDITRWYYDLFTGAVTNKLYADGKGTAYTYYDDGRIASRKWARGALTTTYGYNDTAIGSIRTTRYSDSTSGVTNTFNLTGQLISVLDGTGATTFGYDSKGRQIAETNALAIIIRSYDTYGRYIRFTLTPWLSSYPSFCVNYSYDLFNRLDTVTAIIGTETNIFTYSYIPGTQLVSGYIGTTSTNPQSQIQIQKSFEADRNLISAITNSVGSVPSVVSSFDYSNDTTGKRTARADYYNGSTTVNSFDFNARGEVINAAMNANIYSYAFDDIGNRLQSTVDSEHSTVTNMYVSNELNQYTAVTDIGDSTSTKFYSHDADGNLFSGSGWIHAWNAENRPVQSAHNGWLTTNGSVLVESKYNYKNLRVAKIKKQLSGRGAGYPFDPSEPGTWNAIETRKYIWDGWNIAAEIFIDHETSTTNISYCTWGLDLSGTIQGGGGIGGLLCETKVTSSSTNAYYALADANGNITEYIDETGAVKAHIEYSATGEETYKSGTMKDDFTHRFSTKPYDPMTRLVQYQQRPYDSVFSRWLSRDPVGIKGGLNEVGFVENDPINLVDILGKKIFFVFAHSQAGDFDRIWNVFNKFNNFRRMYTKMIVELERATNWTDAKLSINGKSFSEGKHKFIELAKRESEFEIRNANSKNLFYRGIEDTVLNNHFPPYDYLGIRIHGLMNGSRHFVDFGDVQESSDRVYEFTGRVGKITGINVVISSCQKTAKGPVSHNDKTTNEQLIIFHPEIDYDMSKDGKKLCEADLQTARLKVQVGKTPTY